MNVAYRSKIDLRWYLAVRCEKCQAPILFAVDRGDGEINRPTPVAEKLVLTCTMNECKHRANYTGAAVLRFQKPPRATPKDG
jgi:hypothetical protein